MKTYAAFFAEKNSGFTALINLSWCLGIPEPLRHLETACDVTSHNLDTATVPPIESINKECSLCTSGKFVCSIIRIVTIVTKKKQIIV